MSLFADLGLTAARRLRERLGPRATIRALRSLVAASDPGRARAAAILVGLECAVEVDDEEAVRAFGLWWSVEPTAETAPIATLCARLVRRGQTDLAVDLADEEVTRSGSSHALRVRGACREHAGELDEALADYAAAAEAATDDAAGRASALEQARVAMSRSGRREDAAQAAASVAAAGLSPRELLARSAALLGARGRYARVEGLDALVDFASRSDAIGHAAIRAIAEHVDRSGDSLTEVEHERAVAAFRRVGDAAIRERALAALEELGGGPVAASPVRDRVARNVLAGGSAGPEPDDPGERSRWLALDAIAALRAGDAERASTLLRQVPAASAGQAAWTALRLGLDVRRARTEALELARRLLGERVDAPRGGLVPLAVRLERAGAVDLALRVLEQAADRQETGARSALDATRVRAAWAAAAAGQRADAIALLRAARPR